MGYDLAANNPDADEFHLGAFSYPVIIDVCHWLWPLDRQDGRYYFLPGVDPRMPEGDGYPRVLSNDGFPVTDEEAKIMARMVRNFCIVQESLSESHRMDASK